MSQLNILYIGALGGTCLDRANAFRRLGHNITHIDPRKLLPKSAWIDRITWRLGGQYFSPIINKSIRKALSNRTFDLCHVDNGEWIAPSTVRLLKKFCNKVINYNIDDPTGPRDGARFKAYRQAAPFYDLLAVVREENIGELKALGARNVLRVYRSADEITHAPRHITNEIYEYWKSDVLFLGTWMPERGPLLAKLIEKGVPLSIIGEHWQKAPEWPQLKDNWKGKSVHGDEYAYALQCAKVNIGLVSKGNRDLHTTRSLEIPSLGALLCAERTTEHTQMYREGSEALFWSTPEECAEICFWALQNEARRAEIASNGRDRFLANKHGNEDILGSLILAIHSNKTKQ